MKLYIFIGATIVIAAAVFYFLFSGSPKSATTIQPPAGLPVSNSTVFTTSTTGITSSYSTATSTNSATLSLITQAGTIAVTDFVHNNETVADIENPGSYVLAGSLGYCLADGTCPSGAPANDYSIIFNEKTHFFNIVLLSEPLGGVRFSAEQFLMSRLGGISEQQACSLKYYVGTPYWVNSAYDNRNLGFSFCPGATVLPK